MRRDLFYIFAAAVLLSAAEDLRAQDIGAVTINGVKWATANVGEPGKFVDNPWDRGSFFDFDEAVKACPEGWRTPTTEEFDLLVQTPGEWTIENGVNGYRFGGEGSTIFLPASGNRSMSGSIRDRGTDGRYWSSTRNSGSEGFSLGFFKGSVHPSLLSDMGSGLSVRCVRD